MKTPRICEQCGNEYQKRGLRFCSNSCRVTFVNLHNNVAKRPEVRSKIAAAARASSRQAQLMTPAAREKAVKAIGEALRNRPLTPEHRAAIGRGSKLAGCRPPRNLHLVGPTHPNWKGGTSTLRNADFKNPAYKAFRAAVLEQDDWTCQKCGKRGGRLHVHHIKSWAEFPDLRYDPANGSTRCHACHHAEHRGQPRPKGAGPRTLAARLLNPAVVA